MKCGADSQGAQYGSSRGSFGRIAGSTVNRQIRQNSKTATETKNIVAGWDSHGLSVSKTGVVSGQSLL